MSDAELGKTYEDGAVILRQGDVGDCLYVVQEGTLEILIERDGHVTRYRPAAPGDQPGHVPASLLPLRVQADRRLQHHAANGLLNEAEVRRSGKIFLASDEQ